MICSQIQNLSERIICEINHKNKLNEKFTKIHDTFAVAVIVNSTDMKCGSGNEFFWLLGWLLQENFIISIKQIH